MKSSFRGLCNYNFTTFQQQQVQILATPSTNERNNNYLLHNLVFVRQVLVLSRNHAKRCVICDMLPCCKQSNNHVIRCMQNRTKLLFQMHNRSATYYLHRNLFSKTFANIKKLMFANFL